MDPRLQCIQVNARADELAAHAWGPGGGGATNREVSAEFHIAEKTASVHVSRILAKLDVRSRTEAAALAHRQGLVAQGADTP